MTADFNMIKLFKKYLLLKLHLAIKDKIAECRNYQWEHQKKGYEWKSKGIENYKGSLSNFEAVRNEQLKYNSERIKLSMEREKAFLEILQIMDKI